MRSNAASLIMSCVYGLPPTDESNPTVKAVKMFNERLSLAVYPGAFLVDSIPWLRHVPAWAASWKRDAMRFYATDSDLFQGLFNCVRQASVRTIDSGVSAR